MNIFTKIKFKIDDLKHKYHEFKTVGAGRTMFYGRYRRIELLKKVGIVAVGIIVLIFLISFVSNKIDTYKDYNIDFAYLKNYFHGNGYSCVEVEKSGGKCFIKSDNGSVTFTRYDEGFTYLIKTDTYEISIRHIVNTYNDITFITTDKALQGYRNKTYTCYTDSGITGKLDSCVTNKKEKLDSDVYLGVIDSYITKLNEIITASGYDRDELLNNYYWEK